MTIIEYLDSSSSSKVSLVGAILKGEHALRKNLECDQIYYVLSGTGSATVDGESSELSAGDVVFIGANSTHQLQGDLELLIVNGPAYDFAQTQLIQ
jgi:mannose-6-phosphate isomerase-like protein (cupin superfamily)